MACWFILSEIACEFKYKQDNKVKKTGKHNKLNLRK